MSCAGREGTCQGAPRGVISAARVPHVLASPPDPRFPGSLSLIQPFQKPPSQHSYFLSGKGRGVLGELPSLPESPLCKRRK